MMVMTMMVMTIMHDDDGAAENINDNILITIQIQLSHIFGLVAGVMSVVVMVWLDVR